jgi:hypothetical protein
MKKQRLPEYHGNMIVCLGKERPINSLKEGRELIGDLTKIKIVSSNIKNKNQTSKNLYSERDIVVPAFICNPFSAGYDKAADWTRTNSPIVQIKCAPYQRWWPKSIFKCSQRLGDIAEKIIVETNTYILHLIVSYAYTQEQTALFDDIPDYANDGEAISSKPSEPVTEEKAETEEGPNEIDSSCFPEAEEKEEEKQEDKEGKNENKEKYGYPFTYSSEKTETTFLPPESSPKEGTGAPLKIILGIGGVALLGTAIFFGVKFFLKRKQGE